MVCICSVSYIVLFLLILKVYCKLSIRWNRSYKCLVGKTVLVTGANTGIGYYVALDFAKRGARVILGCRNKTKAEEAQRMIIKATGNENIIVKIVNMESFDSVRSFAKDFNETEERLDILVNNAGVISLDYETQDGYPVVMQVNYLSPFLLTHLLIGKLRKSAPSRIIIVASDMIRSGKIQPEDICAKPKASFKILRDTQMYSNSKLCNALFSIELDKRLKHNNIIVQALHPGAIFTNIFENVPFLMYWIFYYVSWLWKTAEEGAQTPLYAALSEDAGRAGGRFFDNCKDVGHYQSARDSNLAREVWVKSEELVYLKEEEKIK